MHILIALLSCVVGVLIFEVYFQRKDIRMLEEEKKKVDLELDLKSKANQVERDTYIDTIKTLKTEVEYLKLYVEKLESKDPDKAEEAKSFIRDKRMEVLRNQLFYAQLQQQSLCYDPMFNVSSNWCNSYPYFNGLLVNQCCSQNLHYRTW